MSCMYKRAKGLIQISSRHYKLCCHKWCHCQRLKCQKLVSFQHISCLQDYQKDRSWNSQKDRLTPKNLLTYFLPNTLPNKQGIIFPMTKPQLHFIRLFEPTNIYATPTTWGRTRSIKQNKPTYQEKRCGPLVLPAPDKTQDKYFFFSPFKYFTRNFLLFSILNLLKKSWL